MPELPEVETTRRMLEARLKGLVLQRVSFEDDRYRGVEQLAGLRLTALRRRGKYLRLCFEGKKPLDALVHLRMTGGFRLASGGYFLQPPPHERIRFVFDHQDVAFVDIRRFGTWQVVEGDAEPEPLLQLGPEPLGDDFELESFQRVAAQVHKIKPALLSQRLVAGLGNIYADEALWQAGIHPEASHLSSESAQRLFVAIRDVLTRALLAGGSTLSDASYQQPDGRAGGFQFEHRVYGRNKLPCDRCGGLIQKYVLAGRGTHYCPTCQQVEPR